MVFLPYLQKLSESCMPYSNLLDLKGKLTSLNIKINNKINELNNHVFTLKSNYEKDTITKRVTQLIIEQLKFKARLFNYNILDLTDTQITAFLKHEYANLPYRFMEDSFKTDIVRSKLSILQRHSETSLSDYQFYRLLQEAMQNNFALRMLDFIETTLTFGERRILGLEKTATISPCSRLKVYWEKLSGFTTIKPLKTPLHVKVKTVIDYHELLWATYLKPFDDESKNIFNARHSEKKDGIFFAEADVKNPLQAIIEYKSYSRRLRYQEQLNETYLHSLSRFDFKNNTKPTHCSFEELQTLSDLTEVEAELDYFHDIKNELNNIEAWVSTIQRTQSVLLKDLEIILNKLDNSFIFIKNNYTPDVDKQYTSKTFTDKSKEFSNIIKVLKANYNYILDAVFNYNAQAKKSLSDDQYEKITQNVIGVFSNASHSSLINQHQSRYKILQPAKTRSKKLIEKRLSQLYEQF